MKKFLAVFSLFFALPLYAQDVSLEATFGTVKLSSGFAPDPKTYEVVSGGKIAASHLGGECEGFIAEAPDFEFTFSAGILELWVSVISAEDTTLVINTPNGDWICDDDSGGDLDPSVYFGDAPNGVFDVWIGTYDSTVTYDAVLYISELGPYGN